MAKSGAAAMELDFVNMEKEPTTNHILELGLNFLDILHGVSKMNLGVVKTVIDGSTPYVPCFSKQDQHQPHRSNDSSETKNESNGPLTIFYNGTAENIVKPVMESSKTITTSELIDSKSTACSIDHRQFVATVNNNGDWPIVRRKSQGRFLEKRRQRMAYVAPYG